MRIKKQNLSTPAVQHGLAIAAVKIIGIISFLQHQLSLGYADHASQLKRRCAVEKMTKDLDLLTREELGRLFPIIISEPKAKWPDLFVQEKKQIIELLGKRTAIKVEHMGSAAVPNLPAKPTIDILVEIPKGDDVHHRIKGIMTSHWYIYMQEQTNHLMFVKGYTPEGFKGQCFHEVTNLNCLKKRKQYE